MIRCSRSVSLLVAAAALLVLAVPTAGSRSGRNALDPSTASTDVGHALALLENGKVVLAGVSVRGGRYELALVRYEWSGKLDSSFGSNGIVLTRPLGGASAIAEQADGKLVVAGTAAVSERQSGFALARYTRGGGLDATFGRGGEVVTAVAAPPPPGKFNVASAEGVALRLAAGSSPRDSVPT